MADGSNDNEQKQLIALNKIDNITKAGPQELRGHKDENWDSSCETNRPPSAKREYIRDNTSTNLRRREGPATRPERLV